ncbi:retrovirus-related pol polyprotein from transposon TNT 1-94 [Tanacetum coccineum]
MRLQKPPISVFKVFTIVYAIVNHHKVAKEIWDRVKLLMQGTKLSLQEKEYKLYDEFDKFTFVKGETLYLYYWRFAQLINNMNVINMSMRAVQGNTKFLNNLPPEWSKFVTYVKLARDLHTANYNQLYSYLKQHEFPQIDSGLVVPVFNPGDDPIACLNKAMDFLTTIASSSYKGNTTSSGGNNIGGRAKVGKCYNCQGEGHMARQCTQLKRPRNAAWFKEKVPHSDSYHNDMDNQSVHAMQDFEQTPIVDFSDNEITSDSNIIPYS